jgi:UDP-glucuronate decarboxylase
MVMRKVLVTGGAGNVGGALALGLAQDPGTQVTVVDNFATSTRAKLPIDPYGRILFVQADVNNWDDLSVIMLSDKFDYVFHYAALVGVQRTLSRPNDVLQDIQGISNILRLSKNTGVKRVFYSSSSEVYGEPVEFPQNETTTPLNSRLPYAIVKNVGEAFFRSYHQEYGLDYTIFRFFNTYGTRQSADFVVSKFIRAALSGEPITLYGEGRQTRTFCYADDNVECAIRCLNEDRAVNEVLNIGSDVETSIAELARLVIDVTGSSSPIVHLPPLAEGDMTRRLPDNAKMKQILGRDLMPLSEGLKILVERFRQPA